MQKKILWIGLALVLAGSLQVHAQYAITHRAYHTALPDGFKQLDDKWPKFVFGEPGFHFGFHF